MADENQQRAEPNVQAVLQEAQAIYRRRAQDQTYTKELEKIRLPSRLAYFIRLILSLASDIIDIIAAIILIYTGGASEAVDLPLGGLIAMLFIIDGWFQNHQLKKAVKPSALIRQRVELIDQRIRTYRNAYAGILRTGRKVKVLRKPIRTFALAAGKLTRFTKKGVLGSTIWRSIAQIIPFIDLWFWQTQNTRSIYKARKRAHADSQELIKLYAAALADEETEIRELGKAMQEAA